MLQGKAGLIEVISIRVWVDWTGNKDQGPFVHICMNVYLHVCVREYVHMSVCEIESY